MKTRTMLAVAMSFLAGCANTPSELRARSPDITAESRRPSEAVALCIAEAWREQRHATQQPRSGGGFSILIQADQATVAMADVEPTPTGSRTLCYVLNKSPFESRFHMCQLGIKECQ